MQYLHHQLHHQQLFFRLVINVFQRPRVSSYSRKSLALYFFLSVVAVDAVFVVMSWELISPSPETSLNERICIVGVFVVIILDREGGGIKNLQDADEKKKETILGVFSSTIPVKMYFHFDSSSYCFFIFLILSLNLYKYIYIYR